MSLCLICFVLSLITHELAHQIFFLLEVGFLIKQT